MDPAGEELYPIHGGNIHERRWAARLARAFPLAFCLAVAGLALLGAARCPRLLLALCSFFNVSISLVMSAAGVFCIIGSREMRAQLAARPWRGDAKALVSLEDADLEGVIHLVIVPNYKEDEGMLRQTLASLAEAEGSHGFHVCLATERREGAEGEQKAQRLGEQFKGSFARVIVTSHPHDLVERHLDGSEDAEVPGKASNVKWALHQVYQEYAKSPDVSAANVLLTVADADVIFHPGYFDHIGHEFAALRDEPGSAHKWTMWQAPQLPFRNYRGAPMCSRLWAYVASTYEFGGVCGLRYGGEHLVFSTYSMPLQLAVNARAHEGDVIAEDHHAFLRCFFYAARASALESLSARSEACDEPGCLPRLRLRPVLLPVKATSVVSEEGCVQTWIDRWNQAKRHAQGVAELSYMVLAMYDSFRMLPYHLYTRSLIVSTVRLFFRLMYIHCFPICQLICMVVLTLYFLWNDRSVPMCRAESATPDASALCVMAGLWAPGWPIVMPMVMIFVANVLFVTEAFLRPAASPSSGGGHSDAVGLEGDRGGAWHSEDAGLQKTCGSARLTLAAMVFWDLLVGGGPIVGWYGLATAALAIWSVCVRGNRFEYVTATKAMTARPLLAE